MKNPIVEKIKKLFALATSDNPNEAAAALAKAQELMKLHGLNEIDLRTSPIGEAKSFCCRGQKPPDFLAILAQGIAKLFECEAMNVVNYKEAKWIDEIIFVGFSPSQEICAYTFDVLSRQLKIARKEYIKELRNNGTKSRSIRADAYALGWSKAVYEKVIRLVPKKEKIVNQGTGLTKTNALQAHINKQTKGSVVKSKPSKKTRDQANGWEDGAKVAIQKPVEYAHRNTAKIGMSEGTQAELF